MNQLRELQIEIEAMKAAIERLPDSFREQVEEDTADNYARAFDAEI